MMRQLRKTTGFTIIETVIATVLLSAILSGAFMLLDSSEKLAESTTHTSIALTRIDRALTVSADHLRKGSLASARKTDGSNFNDGDSDIGFAVRKVSGWSGTAEMEPLIEYRWIVPAGETSGDLVRIEGLVQTTMARGLTNFSVSRTGNVFTFTADARSGPDDDSGRAATGTIQVLARNP